MIRKNDIESKGNSITNDKRSLESTVGQFQFVKTALNSDTASTDATASDITENERAVNKVSEHEDRSSSTTITKATNEKCAGKQFVSNNKHTPSDIHIDIMEVEGEEQIQANGLDSSHAQPSKDTGHNKEETELKHGKKPESRITSGKVLKSGVSPLGSGRRKLEQTMSVPTIGTKLQRSIRQRIHSLSLNNGSTMVSLVICLCQNTMFTNSLIYREYHEFFKE